MNKDLTLENFSYMYPRPKTDKSADRVDYFGLKLGESITEPYGHQSAEQPAESSGAMREKRDAIPYDLVPFIEITEAYTRVAEFGARKYAAWNWSLGLKRVQLCGSLLRHVFAYIRGEDRDKESGLLHTDHILWNAAALSHNVHWNLEDGRRGEPERAYKTRPET